MIDVTNHLMLFQLVRGRILSNQFMSISQCDRSVDYFSCITQVYEKNQVFEFLHAHGLFAREVNCGKCIYCEERYEWRCR